MTRYKYLIDCQEGDWVYHDAGELVQVVKSEGNYDKFELTTGLIRTMCNNYNTKVYPLTIHSKIIAESIRYYYDEMHKNRLINGSKWVNWLSERFDELMALDDDAKQEEYDKIWKVVKDKVDELKYHASFL